MADQVSEERGLRSVVVFGINWKETLYRKNRILGIREKSPPRCRFPDLFTAV